MVQFGALKFCRTILVSLRGLKKVTILVAFHFMKRRLKWCSIVGTSYDEPRLSLLVLIVSSFNHCVLFAHDEVNVHCSPAK